MGAGDNIMGSGMARGAVARGRLVAFGDGERIRWDQHSEAVFRGNPNVARPGIHDNAPNLEWIAHYKGSRLYNRNGGSRWIWNYDFKAVPGELFLDHDEIKPTQHQKKGFVVIEPNIPAFKSIVPNKQWPVNRYEDVAGMLRKSGFDVVQFMHRGSTHRLGGTRHINTATFRHAVAYLKKASLYIGPEGGLHHAAAAVGTRAVVLFGGFIPPAVTGYDMHTNLTGGETEFCGSFNRCDHCVAAMRRIGADEVFDAALKNLERQAA